MSDITIPIPFNGGSIQTNIMQTHSCYLGNGKFINAAAQLSPNYLFAWITNSANFTSGTFTSTNATARAIMQGTAVPSSINSIRLFKLTSTSALLCLNQSVYVLTIDGSDNVTIKTATIANYYVAQGSGTALSTLNTAYATSTNSYAAQGSAFQAFYARDNVIYTMNATVSNSTTTVVFKKLVYDPTGDALTSTTLYTYTTPGSSALPLVRAELQDIPGSTTKLLSLRLQATSTNLVQVFGSAYIVWAALVDATDTLTNVPAPASVWSLCPLSTTTILGFTSQRTYLTYIGGAWGPNPAYFGANGTTAPTTPILSAYAIDSNYFLLLSTTLSSPGQSTSTDISSLNPQIFYRIGRFVDNQFGQTSVATAAGAGVAVPLSGYMVYDQSFVFRDGSVFYIPQRLSNAVTPVFRTLFAPGT
jgi:hypothetical protein